MLSPNFWLFGRNPVGIAVRALMVALALMSCSVISDHPFFRTVWWALIAAFNFAWLLALDIYILVVRRRLRRRRDLLGLE